MDQPIKLDEKTGFVLICAWHENPSKKEQEELAARLYPGKLLNHICCPECRHKLQLQPK